MATPPTPTLSNISHRKRKRTTTSDESYEKARRAQMLMVTRREQQIQLAMNVRQQAQCNLHIAYAHGTRTTMTTLDALPSEIWTMILQRCKTSDYARLCCTTKGVASRIVYRNVRNLAVYCNANLARMTCYEKITHLAIVGPVRSTVRTSVLNWLPQSHIANTLVSLTLPHHIHFFAMSLPHLQYLECYSANLTHFINATMTSLVHLDVRQLVIPYSHDRSVTEWHMPALKWFVATSADIDHLHLPPTLEYVGVRDLSSGLVTPAAYTSYPNVKALRLHLSLGRHANIAIYFPNLVALIMPRHEFYTKDELPQTLRLLSCMSLTRSPHGQHMPKIQVLVISLTHDDWCDTYFEHIQLLVCISHRSMDLDHIREGMPRLQQLGIRNKANMMNVGRCLPHLQALHCEVSTNGKLGKVKHAVPTVWHTDFVADMRQLSLQFVDIVPPTI